MSGPSSQYVSQEAEGTFNEVGYALVPANVQQVTVSEHRVGVSVVQETKSSKGIKGFRSRVRRSLGRGKKVCSVLSFPRLSC